MSDPAAVVQSFYDRFAAGDMDATRPLFADDAVIVTPAGTMDVDGHEQMGRAFKGGFPDSHMDVTRMVSVGDDVWVTGNFRGTHTGDLPGEQGPLPATGKAIDLPFAEVFTINAGVIARQETYWDQLTMMAQLGVAPGG